MIILIPTLDRVNKQSTWDNLPREVIYKTRLVVSAGEEAAHRELGRRTTVCPVQGRGMPLVRQWMLEYAARLEDDRVIMMDDDLKAAKRREGGRISLSDEAERLEGIDWLFSQLETIVHCGWSERSMDWDSSEEYIDNTRTIQAVGYRARAVLNSGASFSKDVPDWYFMEDYHMTLQLLRKGFPNRRSLVYRYNCSSFNTPGGCNLFRSEDRMREAPEILARLHSHAVKVGFRNNRPTVNIQWRKAYQGV